MAFSLTTIFIISTVFALTSRKYINNSKLNNLPTMHILDAEDMQQLQKDLLKIQLTPNYTLTTPNKSQLNRMAQTSNSLFLRAHPQTEKQIHKFVKLTNNMVAVPFKDSNSVFRILIYGLFSIIYAQDQPKSKEKTTHGNLLLESLKCSLYSKDINFKQIKNKPFALDNTPSKAMVAHFFNSVSQLKQSVAPFTCALWFLEHNKSLIEIFILFFRSILMHLQVEKAEDYQQQANLQDSITSLVEYFDLSYRNFGEMILFYEEGLFLVISEKEFVFGEYYQNETEVKSNQSIDSAPKQPANQKNNNSYSSFTVNPVIESDMKKFYFMLDSNHSSEKSIESIHEHEREVDIETPYFHENSEQFNFGRKKREENTLNNAKQEQMTHQFETVMMDIQEIQSETESKKMSVRKGQEPTPFMGIGSSQKTAFDMQLSFEIPKKKPTDIVEIPKVQIKLMEIKQVDSPIYESSDQFKEIPTDFSKRGTYKNLVVVKDKCEAPFSPQGDKMVQSNDVFSSQAYQGVRYPTDQQQETHKSSEGMNGPLKVQSQTYKACDCRFERLKRNAVSSKVVDFAFCPEKLVKKKASFQFNSPKFLSLKSIASSKQNLMNSKTDLKVPKEQSLNRSQDLTYKKEERKPTFLKFLKKDKGDVSALIKQEQKSYNEMVPMSQSKISQNLHDKASSGKGNYKQGNSKTSSEKNKAAVTNAAQQIAKQLQRSDHRSIDKHKGNLPIGNKNVLSQAEHLKKYDQSGICINPRPAFGESAPPWQANSNFGKKSNANPQSNKNGTSTFCEHNNPAEMQSRSPLKFYAPVQIIAPTVYFTANQGESNNRIFFQMNNQMPGKQATTEVRKSQNFQNPPQPTYWKQATQSLPSNNPAKFPNHKN